MTLSFMNRNMLALAAALAVTLGADFSTTIIAQILIFDLSWLSPLLIIVGAILVKRFDGGSKYKSMGMALVGLGLMLLSLSMIREFSAPLKDSEILVEILQSLNGEPILAVLFAGILTYLLHSSLAMVLFYASLASQGLIPAELGILLVMGANLGSACIPFIASLKDTRAALRLGAGNLAMRGAMVLLLLPFASLLVTLMEPLMTGDAARQIVMFHTAFNGFLAIAFLPFVQTLAKRAEQIIPDKRVGSGSEHLTQEALSKPVMALSGASRVTLQMSDLITEMFEKSFQAIRANNSSLVQEAKQMDEKLDGLFNQIKFYLTQLEQNSMTAAELHQYRRIMAFATNLEHSGDVIQNSMSETILQKIELQEKFSAEGWVEIKNFHQTVKDNMQTAQSVFMSQSLSLAEEMLETKKQLKELERISRRNHFNRLSQRKPQSVATSGVHIDLMRDMGRINSYMTSIAYETVNSQDEGENPNH